MSAGEMFILAMLFAMRAEHCAERKNRSGVFIFFGLALAEVISGMTALVTQ